jgi:hypothetical protein
MQKIVLLLLVFVSYSFAQETDLVRQIGIGPVQAILAFVAFVALLVVIFAKPVWGLAGTICYYPFITGSTALGLPQIFAGLLIVIFLLFWFQRRLAWRSLGKAGEDYNRVKTTFLLFGVYLIANALISGIRGTPPIDIIRDMAPWSGLAMFLFMETFVRKEKDLNLLLAVQIAIMAMITIYVLQWFIPALRPVLGLLGIKSSFLGILAILLIGAAGVVFKILPKWLAWTFCATSGFYFILTPTRTHFLVAVIAVTAMIALTARKRQGLVLALFAAASAFGVYSVVNRYMESTLLAKEARFQTVFEHGLDPSMQSRLDEIVHAWGLFTESPVTGIGAGHRYRLWRHWVGALKGPGYYYDNFMHSDVLNFLAKLGIIGIALYLAFYYKITAIAWKLWKTGQNDQVKASGLICFLLLIAAFIAGQSTPIIQTRLDCLFLGFIMGYTYCAWRLMKSKGRETLVDVKGYSLKYS